jgi:hypothetical protein
MPRSVLLNGTSLLEISSQAPAIPKFVTNSPPFARTRPSWSVLLSRNATTLPALSDAKASRTSPLAMLGPYAFAVKEAIVIVEKHTFAPAIGATVPVTLKIH